MHFQSSHVDPLLRLHEMLLSELEYLLQRRYAKTQIKRLVLLFWLFVWSLVWLSFLPAAGYTRFGIGVIARTLVRTRVVDVACDGFRVF